MMRIGRITSAARILDPRYPTNLAIGLITIAVGALTLMSNLINGGELVDSLLLGILNAGAVFAAWAISRELDPDHELSAFVATAMAIFLVFAVDDPPQLLPLVWLVLAIRGINRTTGLGPTPLDLVTILALGTWLGFAESWAYLAATTLALIIIGISPDQRRRSVALAVIAAGLSVISFTSENAVPQATASLFALGMSALFVPVLLSSSAPISEADFTGIRLEGRRLQMGQVFALAAGPLVALWGGLYDLLPLWAAILGVSLYWAAAVLRQHYPRLANSK